MKAKYIGRYPHWDYGEYIVDLEYEYRGYRYTVSENRSRGNEPLSWQHRAEQRLIDRIIEEDTRDRNRRKQNNGPSADECVAAFLKTCETGDMSFWDK